MKTEPTTRVPQTGESDLLPCPFCGAPGQGLTWEGEHTVHCSNEMCHVSPVVENCGTQKAAVEAWNSRTTIGVPTPADWTSLTRDDLVLMASRLQAEVDALKLRPTLADIELYTREWRAKVERSESQVAALRAENAKLRADVAAVGKALGHLTDASG